MCNTTEANNTSWLINSGCTNYMTAHLTLFKDLDKNYLSKFRIGNGDYEGRRKKELFWLKNLPCTREARLSPL